MEFVATTLSPNVSGNYDFESLSIFRENNESDIDLSNMPVLRGHIGKWSENISIPRTHNEVPKPIESPEEDSLLATIQGNSHLPETEQRRYQELWHKCEYETLTETELAEYQTLVNELDTRNLKRLEALIALAELRGKTIDDIIAEVEVKEENGVI